MHGPSMWSTTTEIFSQSVHVALREKCNLSAHPFSLKTHLISARFGRSLRPNQSGIHCTDRIVVRKESTVAVSPGVIERIEVSTRTVATDCPESDGRVES